MEKHIYTPDLLKLKREKHESKKEHEERSKVLKRFDYFALYTLDLLVSERPTQNALTIPNEYPSPAVEVFFQRLRERTDVFQAVLIRQNDSASSIFHLANRIRRFPVHPEEQVLTRMQRKIHEVIVFAQEQNKTLLHTTPFLKDVIQLSSFYLDGIMRANEERAKILPEIMLLSEHFQAIVDGLSRLGVRIFGTEDQRLVRVILDYVQHPENTEFTPPKSTPTLETYLERKIKQFTTAVLEQNERDQVSQEERAELLLELVRVAAEMNNVMGNFYEASMLPRVSELDQQLKNHLQLGIQTAVSAIVHEGSAEIFLNEHRLHPQECFDLQVMLPDNVHPDDEMEFVFVNEHGEKVQLFWRLINADDNQSTEIQIAGIEQLTSMLLSLIRKNTAMTSREFIEYRRLDYIAAALQKLSEILYRMKSRRKIRRITNTIEESTPEFGRSDSLILINEARKHLNIRKFQSFFSFETDIDPSDEYFWLQLSLQESWLTEFIQWSLAYHGAEHFQSIFSQLS